MSTPSNEELGHAPEEETFAVNDCGENKMKMYHLLLTGITTVIRPSCRPRQLRRNHGTGGSNVMVNGGRALSGGITLMVHYGRYV